MFWLRNKKNNFHLHAFIGGGGLENSNGSVLTVFMHCLIRAFVIEVQDKQGFLRA